MNRDFGLTTATAIAASALMLLPAVAGLPAAAADPADPAATEASAPADAPNADQAVVPAGGGDPVSAACTQFGGALNLAASNYEDFAYATAGNGNSVDYQDPTVWRSNVVGRTALREAAAAALSASHVPGLPPEVSDPMQSWSLHATKLVLVMGLHGGGDSLNSSATQLNSDAHIAQLACARNGGHA